MQRTTLMEDDPNFSELLRALTAASEELLPFAIVCCGEPMRAEAYLQDALLLSLENSWFCRAVDNSERFTHKEFREDILKLLWERVKDDSLKGIVAGIRTYGESSAAFYRMNMTERATLFLRMRLKLSYEQIGAILSEDSIEVLSARVHEAREQLLGRPLASGTERIDEEC